MSPSRTSEALQFAETFDVSRETIHRLEIYVETLSHWQRSTNLVSSRTLSDIWTRHIADCAQLIRLKPDVNRWADLGSGAGLPGIIVAILLDRKIKNLVYLIESNKKKCSFLKDVAAKTRVPVEIRCERIESLSANDRIPPVGIVTARALAPMSKLLEYAHPFIELGATGLFMKGRGVENELIEAAKAWSFSYTLHPSLSDPESAVVEVSDLKPRREG